MRKAEWYVVQVQTGREDKACKAIQRLGRNDAEQDTDEVLLEECFSPTYAFRRKEHGEWVPKEARLLPGYVIAVTSEPWELQRVLCATPEFTRLVKMGETFIPLSADDRSWIERWTKEGDRTIPISVAHKKCKPDQKPYGLTRSPLHLRKYAPAIATVYRRERNHGQQGLRVRTGVIA